MFLDKTWFGPVGRTLEERDAYLREKLASVKDDSGELNRLQVPPSVTRITFATACVAQAYVPASFAHYN